MKVGRRARITLAALALTVFGVGVARLARPALRDLKGTSTAIFDRRGGLLRLTLSSDEKYRVWEPLAAISPVFIEAMLLQEDRHFRAHPGLNPAALARAFWTTYVKAGARQGGSTITMQLARLLYGMESRRLPGKLEQLGRALELELLYSKDEILEAYLNLIPFGGNLEGVGAASLIFFHKPPARLSLGEALALAVIPKNPNLRSLRLGEGTPKESLKEVTTARAALFARWKAEYPDDAGRSAEMGLPIQAFGTPGLPFGAPHFVDAVLADGPGAPERRTTLHPAAQQLLEREVASFFEARHRFGVDNGAALIADTRTMEVVAAVGSADYFSAALKGQVNGTRAKRSPGSALKPFVYALAIDQGLIHARSMLKDAPMSFGAFDPENFDHEFAGPIGATEALVKSRNIPAVHLASRLASPGLYGLLQESGVTRLRAEKHYGLSIVLGGAEVTLEELARLYGMLGNGGVLRPLRYLLRETGAAKGKAVTAAPPPTGPRLLSAEAAAMTVRMLETNSRPGQLFRSGWTRDQFPVAWKTGTSHGFRDAWAIGLAGPYLVATWLGDFDGRRNSNLIGRDMAGPLFFRIVDGLRSVFPDVAEFQRVPPLGLAKTRVCAISGELPGPHCRQLVGSWFIPGKSPIRTCEIHREVRIREVSGRRICADRAEAGSRAEVFEFWPSDLLRLFRQAGIPRRVPPAYESGCGIDRLAETGVAPQIVSPRLDLTYELRMADHAPTASVPLSAVTDGDVRDLYWFSNEVFIGRTRSAETLFWPARPGHHLVRVVDDHGRADSRPVEVSVVR